MNRVEVCGERAGPLQAWRYDGADPFRGGEQVIDTGEDRNRTVVFASGGVSGAVGADELMSDTLRAAALPIELKEL